MRRFFLSLILSLAFAGTALAADLPAADPAEFSGKTIGVLTGSMQEQWAATEFPESKLAYFSSAPDGVLALEAGKVDALFFSDVPLRYTIGERKDMEILAAGAETIPVAQIFG
ncbi:MAG: transporter substrate-binding domain-containing protein, partial [Eubacteriales bacterium]|nr:transporter substrate-binding domain-containing protein [Eubacteriales bacterium]